jgi:hypothetical protein
MRASGHDSLDEDEADGEAELVVQRDSLGEVWNNGEAAALCS